MQRKLRLLISCLLVLWCLPGCVERFELPESTAALDRLVVDGNVHIEAGTAWVKLSRTQNLADAARPVMTENAAQVWVEDEQNGRHSLQETLPGIYTAAGLPVTYGRNYRLRIRTQGGKEYLSDYMSAERTPAISEIPWHVERNGIQMEVSTAGTPEGTRFYRWEYVETYQYETKLFSAFDFQNNVITRRKPDELLFRCWRSEVSRNILVGTAQQMEQNVINRFPLLFREGHGDRFSKKYSLLVRQYAISRQEYDYWLMLQKNTESVGSLFDAQPSFVTGNLTCVSDPAEEVFGYFSAHSITEKRLFIDANELRDHQFRVDFPMCEVLELSTNMIPAAIVELNMIILDSVRYDPQSRQTFYVLAPKECGDCRGKGGTTLKPAFWP